MVFLGFLERVGEEDQQRVGFEAFCQGIYRRQSRRFFLGQGLDVGVKYSLGDRVCIFYIKVDAVRVSFVIGKVYIIESLVQQVKFCSYSKDSLGGLAGLVFIFILDSC